MTCAACAGGGAGRGEFTCCCHCVGKFVLELACCFSVCMRVGGCLVRAARRVVLWPCGPPAGKGTVSIVSGVIGAGALAGSSITSSVGSGLSLLSFDRDYISRRQVGNMLDNSPHIPFPLSPTPLVSSSRKHAGTRTLSPWPPTLSPLPSTLKPHPPPSAPCITPPTHVCAGAHAESPQNPSVGPRLGHARLGARAV